MAYIQVGILIKSILNDYVDRIFSGETINGYYFVRTKLNWEALEEAPYAAFNCLTTFIGKFSLLY